MLKQDKGKLKQDEAMHMHARAAHMQDNAMHMHARAAHMQNNAMHVHMSG